MGANVVMLGAFAAKQNLLMKEKFLEAMKRKLKKMLGKNVEAFELGYNETVKDLKNQV